MLLLKGKKKQKSGCWFSVTTCLGSNILPAQKISGNSRNMSRLLQLLTTTSAFLLVGSFLKSQLAYASTLTTLEIYEFKRTIELEVFEEKTEQVFSGFSYSLEIDTESPPKVTSQIIFNEETSLVSAGTYSFDLFNVYVAEITFEGTFVDLFWLMVADDGTGISALPDGWILEEASIFGASTNAEFTASITPINDLINLPTSSLNNTNIVWDLSQFSETTGDFFLARATLPVIELQKTPESSNLLGIYILGTLGASIIASRFFKRQK